MLAMGSGLLVRQIIEPLNLRLVVLSLVANFVFIPLGALVLARALGLDEQFGIGLLIVACAAGAPLLPKLAQLSKGSVPFAVGTMVMLMVITVAYLPIVLPLLLQGVTVSAVQIAKSLVFTMLLPLGVGLLLRAYAQAVAARVKPWVDGLSSISLIAVIGLVTVANFSKVLQVFGTRAIFASLLFIAFGYCIGWLLGGPRNEIKRVMALGTAQRNVAAALVVASQSFSDPKVSVMVVVVMVASLVTLMPLARVLGNRRSASA